MAERGKAGSGRKFSITIQVPEEVGAGWPDRATAERLIHEVYQAMGGQVPAARPGPRSRAAALLLAFALGAASGYLGAAGLPLLRPRSAGPPAVQPAPAPAASAPESPAPAEASPPAASAEAEPTTPQPSPQAPPAEPSAASPAPVAPAAEYRVQAGAFRQRANAVAQVGRLARDGFQAEIRRSGILYVVVVGPPHSREDADLLAARLRERGYDALVVRAP
ncbi:MAG: SPOR domain-containing protein [Armatimonadota bacterium]|nr:SPOR domain-containing protein [Armatimonadota bacterium]MDR7508753.1 SPOR domain-containing protein [Armatimonadota bacterium]MDR7559748.1 SPOR domain-containing protein [Armatimonadota bacterium]MDR7587318.1 SPOR domain-containing protein [Armatimonadota bacterium]MDR7611098.1 SPOR domain-containing protein [Armatimonadota bacterium]